MDLLFRSYASPFLFIDSLIDSDMLVEGIINMFEKENDNKLWQMYLTIKPNQSFKEWKKSVLNKNTQVQHMTKEKAEIMLKESEDILNNFHIESG